MPQADDQLLARELAEQAGRRLLDLRKEGRAAPAKELRDAGDKLSHDFLIARLARERPADAVLSEEGADGPERLSAGRVWIIDPLDGTREYGEPGRTDWAVHVALWQEGELAAGAVALPAQGQVLSTACPPVTGGGRDQGPLRLLVSRSRPPDFMAALAAELAAELVPMGSAGAKAAAVINGQAEAYVHSGGQYEWDSAAPVAVARAAGLHTSRIDGSALRYNQANPSVPDILICPIERSSALLSAIDRSRHASQAVSPSPPIQPQ